MKQFGSFRLDAANECLWRGGEQIALQPKPYAVLRYLVENPGRLITHDELLDKLWPETYVQPQILRTYMLELRRILGDSLDEPKFIQTLPKRGYCFVASVAEGASHSVESGSAPIVSTAALSAQSKLVGREKELARLCVELQQMLSGQRRIVLLSGEAGIGKTTLTDALAETWCCNSRPQPSILLARGQCVPGFGSREQYYPVLEALGHICASPDGEAVCRVLLRMAPEWLALLGRQPAQVQNPTQLTSTDMRHPGNICTTLEELSTIKPLIFIFEDMQWADDSTLHLLSALARRRGPAKLMIVATYRPRDIAADHTLRRVRQDLMLQRLCTEIVLEPLPKADVLALLSMELGIDAPPPRLVSIVQHHAEGNPLFVISILQHLIAQRLLFRDSSEAGAPWELAPQAETESAIPDELAQMVELEICRLPEEDQRILEAGSLMSVAFPAWSAAAALNGDLMEIEEACERLARNAHFVQHVGLDELPDGSRCSFYAFTHGIYREVLYHRQSESRRARRHIRIAERLGDMFAGREAHVAREIAMHYEAAGDQKLGVQALRTAAEYALARQSRTEAAELLERAEHLAASANHGQNGSGVIQLTRNSKHARIEHVPAHKAN